MSRERTITCNCEKSWGSWHDRNALRISASACAVEQARTSGQRPTDLPVVPGGAVDGATAEEKAVGASGKRRTTTVAVGSGMGGRLCLRRLGDRPWDPYPGRCGCIHPRVPDVGGGYEFVESVRDSRPGASRRAAR